LVVAHRTGVTDALLEAVRERVEQGPAWFHVLVPDPSPPALRAERGRQVSGVTRSLDTAVALVEEAARRPTDGSVSVRRDPMDAIEEALLHGDFDEIILSTRQPGVSRRLRMDLPARVAHLGLPLVSVIAGDPAAARAARMRRRSSAVRPSRRPPPPVTPSHA
jgi:hypothetical protein